MISLQRVTKTYRNGVTALVDVDLEVEKGEFVFCVGPSGSGKSTLIRLLLKEEEATKGDVYVAGKNLARITSWKVPFPNERVPTTVARLWSESADARISAAEAESWLIKTTVGRLGSEPPTATYFW